MMYVSLDDLCTIFFWFQMIPFRSHSRLWSCRKFHYSNSEEYTDFFLSYTVEILPYALRAKGFVLFNFLISLSLIFNQYVYIFIPSLFVFTLTLPHLDMWTRLRLTSKSSHIVIKCINKYSSLTRLGWKYYVCPVLLQTCAITYLKIS